ncbi:MAG: hypothetical protein AB7S48_01155 [Bacteroidales bacterium]
METFLAILGLIILITIIFIFGIDFRLYKKLLRFKRNENETSISDEKYYELNYKIQLLIASTSIIVVVGGFLGYNSITSIKSDYNDNVKQYKVKLKQYDSTLNYYKKLVVSIDSQRIQTIEALNVSVKETNRLKTDLINLQKEFSPNVSTFIVKNIFFDRDKSENVRVYYKNLKTIEGVRLPSFDDPPILTILNSGTSTIYLLNITSEYFEYIQGISVELQDPNENKKNSKFDLMITKYK